MGALGRIETPNEDIIKPLTFKAQEFRHIQLDNRMEFLLVSDPELDKAGAAVDVSPAILHGLSVLKAVTRVPRCAVQEGLALCMCHDLYVQPTPVLKLKMTHHHALANSKHGADLSQVRVGSLSDPKDIPGLAHFCEHMLFYASEKFPEEDAYARFLVGCLPFCHPGSPWRRAPKAACSCSCGSLTLWGSRTTS